ncbi:MAG: DUF1345 domain-containing protein [Mycobacterium sp.]|uniref:DUF1345 domain-containing protein n=1 Tax=Mycobacterium sp. TaxID=1785 RepID=UPI00284EB561|nr:DUF1345 domain-containing protein [Mycobacterium sp.]HKI43351.1 DUF1345 domain-containing protein [Mycobacterium sp.]
MEKQAQLSRQTRVVIRLALAAMVGLAVSTAVGVRAGSTYAPAVGWIAAACVYLGWTWIVVFPMNAERTRNHIGPEDPPTRWVSDVVVLLASVASLAGVGHLLAAGSKHGVERNVAAAVGVVSIVAAWLVIHTVFSLRYADVYYSNAGRGISFKGTEEPWFRDFLYLGFTIGMTYQVSDTELETRQLRVIALCQALLSYLFGAVILAVTINLVVGLSN